MSTHHTVLKSVSEKILRSSKGTPPHFLSHDRHFLQCLVYSFPASGYVPAFPHCRGLFRHIILLSVSETRNLAGLVLVKGMNISLSGLCGNARLADVGGPPFLLPTAQRDKVLGSVTPPPHTHRAQVNYVTFRSFRTTLILAIFVPC